MMTATNIHYELADRVQGLVLVASVPFCTCLARRTGLIEAIDRNLRVLKRSTCRTTNRIMC